MTDPKSNADSEEFSNFDRVMRGLVGVDPADLTDTDSEDFASEGGEAEDPCPYCGASMEAGTILGGKQRLRWANGDPSFWNWINTASFDRIGEGGKWACGHIAALRCTKCRRIFLSY